MREIKFRGKRVDNGEWVYGYYTKHVDKESGILGIENNYYWIHDNQGDIHDVDSNTVGQFTGLLDENGKEIYEGDILDSSLYGLCVVEYDEFGTFSPFGHGDYAEISTWLKVIGNIHDNPELLK